jgi:dUTP pyrophosphatase
MSTFRIFRAHQDAVVPKRADKGAAGYDLTSVENVLLGPNERKLIDTGIVIECSQDCYARIAPRSGLAAKYGIDVLAGVVDSSYRGNIKVILYNTDKNASVEIEVGDKIAQLIFERIYTPDLEEVDSIDKLTDTDRGFGGFGSTGKK